MKLKKVFFTLLLCQFITIPLFAKNHHYAVVNDDYVRVRGDAKLKSGIISELFKGNEVIIIGKKQGDTFKGKTLWYKVKSDHFFGEGYLHSVIVYTGKKARNYKKNFNVKVIHKWLKKKFKKAQIKKLKKFLT